jgi:aminoglycoside phosphotransferase family enzyme/predicted kinase
MHDLETSTRLIAALRSPAAYPHPAGPVELVETHISWVLLAGEYAYKIKKPINLGFADFSTLARRRRFCDEEIRLNRRLAPDLYLGVSQITGTPDRPAIDGPDEPIEYAVRMRRFSQDALLSRHIARGTLTPQHIDALAREIADFHSRIVVAGPDSPFGSPDSVRQPAEENFDHLAPGVEEPLVRRLADWSRAEFDARRDDFARRKAAGFVRECHGDMHLGNMLLAGTHPANDRVTIFDGIEFNDDLRWIDVLSETAFAVMDLEDRGRPDFGRRLLNAYLEATGDYDGLAVLPYYLVYRAMVRAKVASIRSRQPDLTAPDRTRLHDELRGYLRLADKYAAPPRPILLLTHGVSGSGKTTAGRTILEATGAIRVRSDVERKRLAGLAPLDRAASAPNTALYSAERTADTYARLAALAESILRAGFPALIDAAFLERRRRDDFRRLAARLAVPFLLLDVHADDTTLRARLERRACHGTDASDADLAVLDRQLRTCEPLAEDERRAAVPIDTARDETLRRAVAHIEALRA